MPPGIPWFVFLSCGSNQLILKLKFRLQVATEICYVDCTPACVYDEVDGCVVPPSLSTVVEGCRFEYIKESGSIFLDYTITIEALDRTGDWNCEYQGVSASRSLKLQASPKLPPMTTISATSATMATANTTSTITSVPATAMIAANFPRTKNQARPKSGMLRLGYLTL